MNDVWYAKAAAEFGGSLVMIGVFLFVYGAIVLYGKMRAAQWQREIDSLRAMRGESS
jgi:hypothetical protein